MDPAEYVRMAEVEQRHPWFQNRRKLVQGAVRRFAGQSDRPRILDAGCGTGVNLKQYQDWGECCGIEFDPTAAQLARERGNGRVVVGDLCALPFGDSAFDIILSTDVLEHIPDDVTALKELNRVLRPAGRIVLTTPAYSWAYSSHDKHLHHVRRYDTKPLRHVIAAAGLTLLHHSRYNVLLAAPLALKRLAEKDSGTSDVGKPIPRVVSWVLNSIWHVEAKIAPWVNLRVGMTHLVVLAKA